MKTLTVLFCLSVSLMGADKKPLTKEESAKVIEAAIRKAAKKPTGELTKADLEKVRELYLVDDQLTDVKGLEKLTKLTALSLNHNQLTDVKGLEKLPQLKMLWLTANHLTDVKGLEKLTQLKCLYLNQNKLTDVKGLEKFTQLKFLILDGNPALTKAQIDELKKALPDCKIEHNAKK
jgi:Leucine-rich repeat (LRR) protein